jgi:hypothetical protein
MFFGTEEIRLQAAARFQWPTPRQTVQATLISKITRAKWTGGVAQAVEHCFASKKH